MILYNLQSTIYKVRPTLRSQPIFCTDRASTFNMRCLLFSAIVAATLLCYVAVAAPNSSSEAEIASSASNVDALIETSVKSSLAYRNLKRHKKSANRVRGRSRSFQRKRESIKRRAINQRRMNSRSGGGRKHRTGRGLGNSTGRKRHGRSRRGGRRNKGKGKIHKSFSSSSSRSSGRKSKSSSSSFGHGFGYSF